MCIIFGLCTLLLVGLLANAALIRAEKERRIQRMVEGANRLRRKWDRERTGRRTNQD